MAEPHPEHLTEAEHLAEERMRYEVLAAVYYAADRCPCVRVDSHQFMNSLGIWRADLARLLAYLTGRGFLSEGEDEMIVQKSKGSVACITQRGIDYIQHDARRRRTVRDEVASDCR